MAIEIPVFEVTQPIGTFYTGVSTARDLLAMCQFDFRRIHEKGGRKEFLGIQRELKKNRISEIHKYIQTQDAVFPTSIVISVDEKCVSLRPGNIGYIMELSEYIDPEDSRLNVPLDSMATVIDGQHRLKSFEGIEGIPFDLPVSIFVGVDDAIEATVFSTVNLAQTKVNRSLVYDLFALDKNRSPEKTCHEIAVALDELPESPFQGRIKRLGTATEGRFGETLSQATVVKGLLPYISKDPVLDRDVGRRFGVWPEDDRSFSRRPFYEFFRRNEDEKILANVINFFSAVNAVWPNAWAANGRGAVLGRTNGFNGLIRYFKDAYLHLTSEPQVISKSAFESVLRKADLDDSVFTIGNFPPGTSGSSKLFHLLKEETGLER